MLNYRKAGVYQGKAAQENKKPLTRSSPRHNDQHSYSIKNRIHEKHQNFRRLLVDDLDVV